MGCTPSEPLPDGKSRVTMTEQGVTKIEGSSAGLRFGCYRISKNSKNHGQDRFATLLRESHRPWAPDGGLEPILMGGVDTTVWNPITRGCFAIAVFDGHGETSNAADFSKDHVLKDIFLKHYADEVKGRESSPPPKSGRRQSEDKSEVSKEDSSKLMRVPSTESLKDLAAPSADLATPQKNAWDFGIVIPPKPPDNSFDYEYTASSFKQESITNEFRHALAPFLVRDNSVRGDVLMKQGEEGDEVILLFEGAMDVFVNETFVRTEADGAILGEIALLRTTVRTATVTCRSDTASFFRLSRDDWEWVLGLNPRFDVVRQVLSNLADDRAGRTAFMERLRSLPSSDESLEMESQPPSPTSSQPGSYPRPADAIISKAFVDADQMIRRKWPQERTGTTATVLLLSPRTEKTSQGTETWDATVAWVGDSRGMMISPDGNIAEITKDHNIAASEERTRILNAGSDEARLSAERKSFSIIKNREHPVTGEQGPEAVFNGDKNISLMVTRSLGDPHGAAAVLPYPEINRPRTAAEEPGVISGTRFILASDGLWDVTSSDKAARLVRGCIDPLKAAAKLAKHARGRWELKGRRDDIIVTIVDVL